MAFADLLPNQMVDENNALTSGFTSIGPKNPATQCYSKAQALSAYNLSASAMSAYTSNQLVPKSVWASGVYYSHDMETSAFSTSAGSCSNPTITRAFPFYAATPGLAVNSILYTNTNLTVRFAGGNQYYRYLTVGTYGSAFRVDDNGVIQQIVACSPPGPYAWNFGSSKSDEIEACGSDVFNKVYYTSTPTLAIGTVLYANSNLTGPLFGDSTYFKHIEGRKSYIVDDFGAITAIFSCPSYVLASNSGENTANVSCSELDPGFTLYSIYSLEFGPLPNTIIYSDPECLLPFDGIDFWYVDLMTMVVMQINSVGQVINTTTC